MELYRQHFIDKQDERRQLFAILAAQFPIARALYPGSFIHITPAFYFQETCFVDTDGRTKKFFHDPKVRKFVYDNKIYPEEPQVRYIHYDYRLKLELEEASFDLLISQYAGFVSEHCGKYLKPGGFLVANNSHGDAGLSFLDERFELAGVISRRGEVFRLSTSDLESYFIPRRPIEVTPEYQRRLGRGIGYKKNAFAYLFRRRAEV